MAAISFKLKPPIVVQHKGLLLFGGQGIQAGFELLAHGLPLGLVGRFWDGGIRNLSVQFQWRFGLAGLAKMIDHQAFGNGVGPGFKALFRIKAVFVVDDANPQFLKQFVEVLVVVDAGLHVSVQRPFVALIQHLKGPLVVDVVGVGVCGHQLFIAQTIQHAIILKEPMPETKHRPGS